MKDEIINHLKKLDAILISSHANIAYLTGFGGFSETEREVFLLITKKKKFIITDGRYSGALLKSIKNFKLIETGAHFFLRNPSEILKLEAIKTLGVEENSLSFFEYKQIKKHAKIYAAHLENLRTIKDKNEIVNIKKACVLGDKAFEYILGELKKSITEKEIEYLIESFIKQNGADISFRPIVAFGKNSSVPHHLSDKTKLKKNQIVLLDFGVKINNYCSDMTRTVFFGRATLEFKQIYETVLKSQTKAIEFINNFYSSSGAKRNREVSSRLRSNNKLLAKDIDKVARSYIVKQGYPNIIHSVGHGIGIEVHETPHLSPSSREIVKPGMVFSVEPGIYIPGFGGIRIEDLVLVGVDKIAVITRAKKSLIEL